MHILTVSEARANLYRLIDETSLNHKPTFIKGKRHNAVLVSEEDWRSLQETFYLLSTPGMVESIKEGIDTPDDACSTEIAFWAGKKIE